MTPGKNLKNSIVSSARNSVSNSVQGFSVHSFNAISEVYLRAVEEAVWFGIWAPVFQRFRQRFGENLYESR